MKTYPITIKSTNYTIKIDGPPGDFQFPTRDERERWTAALRSGDYQQGKGSLSPQVGCYCCLGVLQFLRDNKPPTPENHLTAAATWGSFGLPYTTSADEWARGIFPEQTIVDFSAVPHNCLPLLNDCGMSFADIADIIDIVYNPETYE